MSTNKIIAQIESEQMGKDIPDFGPGDTVVVQVRLRRVTASACRLMKVWLWLKRAAP